MTEEKEQVTQDEEAPVAETPAEMARRLQALLPSPEEIHRMALIEQHNDMIQKKREADLEARRKRRALLGKRGKRKKKR